MLVKYYVGQPQTNALTTQQCKLSRSALSVTATSYDFRFSPICDKFRNISTEERT